MLFLWPENWLEPEFRDEKTHLFTELESALLESDLDATAVEAAFFGYLSGLDEIARLDIRAIYLERKADQDDNVLHVVARTATAPGRYFYRTWSHRSWTPWQPITANIDGDHLAVVVWQGRVHLFWVLFIEQAEATPPEGETGTTRAADLDLRTVSGLRPRKKVEVQLYWSCYTPAGNGPGEWSDPVLANADDPHVATVNQDFEARKVFIWADVLPDDSVSVSLLGQGADQSFTVFSRHAPPEHSEQARVPLDPPYLTGFGLPLDRAGWGRWRGVAPKLRVHVEGHTVTEDGTAPCDITEDILSNVPGPYHLVLVPPPAEIGKSGVGSKAPSGAAPPENPFFYTDVANTFFVEPSWTEFSITDSDQSVVAQSPVWHDFDSGEFWTAQPVAAWFPETPAGLTRLDTITRPESVVRFAGRPVGDSGLVSSADELTRTGPHGALRRR
jgi:hypothetical protein